MSEKKSGTYWNLDRIMKLILGLALVVALVMLINRLRDVLLPFFVACFVAYILEPIVGFNQGWMHTKRRLLPSIVTILDVTVVLGLVVYLFMPSVVRELDMLGGILSDITSGKKPLPPFYMTIVNFIGKYFDPDSLTEMLNMQHIESLISKGSSLLEESIDVILHTLEWMLTLIYILFILIDFPQIERGFKLIIPHKYRPQTLVVIDDVKDSMNKYFRGQGLVALCAAVFYCSGFAIVGLPLAIPMGLLVGLLYMIPYFQYITLLPVSAICFIYSLGGNVDFLSELGKCGLVYVVSQCVCDYIITPHIMGKEMGLNPAVILLSLSVWGSLLGIIGMIIALPVTALIMTYYMNYISYPKKKTESTAVETLPGNEDGEKSGE